MRQRVLSALPYALAAMAAPVLTYLLQPRSCFEHLFLPYVLPVVVLLCLACGAAQSLIGWQCALQVILGVMFALSIQAIPLVPCVSSLEESQRVMRLVVLSLLMTWVAAAILAATAAGLLRSGPFRGSRVVAAMGFALSGASLALGATKQYLGTIGATWSDPFVALAEARLPVSLMCGVAAAVVGTAVAHVQRLYGQSGSAAA